MMGKVPRWWVYPERKWLFRVVELVVQLSDALEPRGKRTVERVLQDIIISCERWLAMRAWKARQESGDETVGGVGVVGSSGGGADNVLS